VPFVTNFDIRLEVFHNSTNLLLIDQQQSLHDEITLTHPT